MKTITATEFRKNMKKYTDLSYNQKVIFSRGNESFAIIPIQRIEEENYNPEFVKEVLESYESAKKGNVTRISDTKDIWKDII